VNPPDRPPLFGWFESRLKYQMVIVTAEPVYVNRVFSPVLSAKRTVRCKNKRTMRQQPLKSILTKTIL
jgi:hypothetical protein